MKDGYTCVASFPQPLEANLAKSKLDSEGIECHLANENTIHMDYFLSQALGGVKLLVPEAELARAEKVLEDFEPPLLADLEAEAMSSPLPESERPPALRPSKKNFLRLETREEEPKNEIVVNCPSCDSANVYNDRRLTTVGFFSFFFGLPFLFFSRNFQCAKCGHKWKRGTQSGKPTQ